MSFLTLTALAILAATPPHQDACPAETPAARRIVTTLLTSAGYAHARSTAGISAAAEPQLLAGADAGQTCAHLQRVVRVRHPSDESPAGRLTPTFYAAGDRYLAVLVRELPPQQPPPGHAVIRLGFTTLLVLDQEMNVVASLAM